MRKYGNIWEENPRNRGLNGIIIYKWKFSMFDARFQGILGVHWGTGSKTSSWSSNKRKDSQTKEELLMWTTMFWLRPKCCLETLIYWRMDTTIAPFSPQSWPPDHRIPVNSHGSWLGSPWLLGAHLNSTCDPAVVPLHFVCGAMSLGDFVFDHASTECFPRDCSAKTGNWTS